MSLETATAWETPSPNVANDGRRARNRMQSSMIRSSQTAATTNNNIPNPFGNPGRRSPFPFTFSPISGAPNPFSNKRANMRSTPRGTILEHLRAVSSTLGLPFTSSLPIPRGAFLPEIADPLISGHQGGFQCGGCGLWIFVAYKLSHYSSCFVERREKQREEQQREANTPSTISSIVHCRIPLASLHGSPGLRVRSRFTRSKSCPSSTTNQSFPSLPSHNPPLAWQVKAQLEEGDLSPVEPDGFESPETQISPSQPTPRDFAFQTPDLAPNTIEDEARKTVRSTISQRTRSHFRVPQWSEMTSSKSSSSLLQPSPPTLVPEFEPLPSPEMSPITPSQRTPQPGTPIYDPLTDTPSSAPFPSFTPGIPSPRRCLIRSAVQSNDPFVRTIDNNSHQFEIYEDETAESFFDDEESLGSSQFAEPPSSPFMPDIEADDSHYYHAASEAEPLSPQGMQFFFPVGMEDDPFLTVPQPGPGPGPGQRPRTAVPIPQIRVPQARRRRASIRVPRPGNSSTPAPRHIMPLSPILPSFHPNSQQYAHPHNNTNTNLFPRPHTTNPAALQTPTFQNTNTNAIPITPPNPPHRSPGPHVGDTWTTFANQNAWQDSEGYIWDEEGRLLAVPVIVSPRTEVLEMETEDEDTEEEYEDSESESDGDMDMMMEVMDATDENVLHMGRRRRRMGMGGAWQG